jgi:DNA-binding response OmpR family regulator
MGTDETGLGSEQALAYLRRIERLLETIASMMQEYLESSRQMLAALALRADVAEVQISQTPRSEGALTIREVTIDPAKHLVTVRGEPVDLTPTEFDILFCLMRNGGRVLSCQELVRQAQGYELDERDARYLIRPHITRLRQKLTAKPGAPEYIRNVRGVGYFFERRSVERDSVAGNPETERAPLPANQRRGKRLLW